MKLSIISILLAILSLACERKLDPVPYDAVTVVSPADTVFDEMFDAVQDDMKVEAITREDFDGEPFLVTEAHSEKGGCTVTKTLLAHTKWGYLYLRAGGTTEKCSGKNCEHCAFKDGGGCKCVNSLNICEHTIIKTSTILRR